jgi:hypothetical protein
MLIFVSVCIGTAERFRSVVGILKQGSSQTVRLESVEQ